MAIERINGIDRGKEKQQNPINFIQNDPKKRWNEELAAGLTGFQNTVNYVKNGGNIFQQGKDTAATSM